MDTFRFQLRVASLNGKRGQHPLDVAGLFEVSLKLSQLPGPKASETTNFALEVSTAVGFPPSGLWHGCETAFNVDLSRCPATN